MAKMGKKIIGKMPHIHLQHSSINSFHAWITHSIHKSENDAKTMYNKVISSFPTHFKWRIIKIK